MQRVHPALVPLALVVGLLACAAPAAPAPPAAPSPASAAPSGAPTAAAAAPTSAPAAPPAPVTLKVGDLRINSSAGTYIALERGYFAEQGLTLDFEPFTTGGEQIPSLANGQLDIGVGAVSAALYNAVGRGVPIKLVVDQGRHVPGRTATAFVVRTDLWESGAIREPADLRGRPIGISSTASTPEILVDRALQRGGLTIRDVNLTVLPFPEMQAAFANRAIDAAAYQEPFTTRGVENGLVVRWFHADEYYPQQQNGVLMFGPNLVTNTEAARGYILAYLRGVREYNAAFLQGERREEVIQILIQHTTIKDRDLYDKMAPSGLGPNGYLNVQGLQDDMQWFVDHGYLQQPVDVAALVDHRFVDYALGVLGRVDE